MLAVVSGTAEAHDHHGGYHRGRQARRSIGIGAVVRADTNGAAATSVGGYYNPYYGGYDYYVSSSVNAQRYAAPGYGYYGYGY